MLGMCFGADTGAALNPARDLGPRLFLAVAGWGADVCFELSDFPLTLWLICVSADSRCFGFIRSISGFPLWLPW